MAKYNFKEDIILGENGERIVIEYLESKGAKLISDNKDNKFDIIIEYKGKQISYEIKTDVYCKPKRDTGNIFIEYECRGLTSGIYVTKADWYVNYFANLGEIWFIKTKDLKQLILDNDFYKVTHAGDDNSNTKGFLIKRNNYKDKFIVKHVKTLNRINP